MRIYNPRNWSRILFQVSSSDTLRKMSSGILAIAVYSGIIAFLEINVFHVDENGHLRNFYQMHTVLGLALSLLLVFRTNTAYDRWWEGRKLWGALVNNSRNLAIKMNALLPEGDDANRDYFARMIALYAKTLHEHLESEYTRYTLDTVAHPELKHLDDDQHAPNQISRLITARAVELQKQGVLTGEQLLFINPELLSFTDICGACERIKNTPIPFSYSSFIKKFIFLYIITLPLGYVFLLGYLVIPVVAIVFYVLGSLEVIAEEIEDPFGTDENDLPMEKMASNIGKHVGEILY